jgi:hypothetical protein
MGINAGMPFVPLSSKNLKKAIHKLQIKTGEFR